MLLRLCPPHFILPSYMGHLLDRPIVCLVAAYGGAGFFLFWTAACARQSARHFVLPHPTRDPCCDRRLAVGYRSRSDTKPLADRLRECQHLGGLIIFNQARLLWLPLTNRKVGNRRQRGPLSDTRAIDCLHTQAVNGNALHGCTLLFCLDSSKCRSGYRATMQRRC